MNLEWWVKRNLEFSSNLLLKGKQSERTVDLVDQHLAVWWTGVCLPQEWKIFNDLKRAKVTAVLKTDKMKDPGNSSTVRFTSLLWSGGLWKALFWKSFPNTWKTRRRLGEPSHTNGRGQIMPDQPDCPLCWNDWLSDWEGVCLTLAKLWQDVPWHPWSQAHSYGLDDGL